MKDDDFLTRYRQAPRQPFADQLYRRINQPMNSPTRTARQTQLRRVSLAFAILILLFAASLALSPAARAFAGDILRQVGAITLAPEPQAGPHSGEVAPAAEPQPTAAPPLPGLTQQAASSAEAARLAGFDLQAPAYLPEGYVADGDWSVTPQGQGVVVARGYRSGDHFLFFNAYRYGPGDQFTQPLDADEVAVEVAVRGTTGVWITGRPMAHPDGGSAALLATSVLMWEEDGVTYSVFGDALSQDEALRVAESLEK